MMTIHLLMDGAKGSSSDQPHKDWIDIVQLCWGSRRRITANSSTRDDRESSNAEISALTFTKYLDESTPALFLEACCGRGQTMTVDMTYTGAGAGARTYNRYVLHNAVVSEYKMAAWAQEGERPLEKIKISFTRVELRYSPSDQDNRPLPPISVSFDTATNSKG